MSTMFIQISYDSKCTGSKELRMDNIENVFPILSTFPEMLTPIGKYVHSYDSTGKFKEPIFDGYLAGIALLEPNEFNKHFNYIPTTYHDVTRPSQRISGLKTQYVEDVVVSREELPISYETSKHVFLLGPMNKTCVDYINTLTGNVIFHVQGEATSDVRKTTTYPDAMTENQGIFPCSFNLWTGEECSRIIRSKMNHSFTVKCVPNIQSEIVRVQSNTGPLKNYLDVSIPSIYVSIRNYMLHQCLMGTKNLPIPLHSIHMDAIFQDMIDKDNLVSCWMLMQHSTTIPKLSLIGRRVYSSSTVPFSEYEFTSMDDRNGDLHFPGFKNERIVQKFSLELTRSNHIKATQGFHALLDGLEYQYNAISDDDIVDGNEDVSESDRAPFHEPFVTKVGFFEK